jgi:hypothetical protein
MTGKTDTFTRSGCHFSAQSSRSSSKNLPLFGLKNCCPGNSTVGSTSIFSANFQ